MNIDLLIALITITAFTAFFQIATCRGFLGKSLCISKTGILKIPTLAVCLHWCIYGTVLNFPVVHIKSDHIEMYNWVVRYQHLSTSAVYSLVFYVLSIVWLEVCARYLNQIHDAGDLSLDWNISLRGPYLIAGFLFISSLLVGGQIGTTEADGGAWANQFPSLIQPIVRGLFVVQLSPTILIVVRSFWRGRAKSTRSVFLVELGVLVIQLVTFAMLRQRFMTLIELTIIAILASRVFKKYLVGLWGLLGALISYSVPTALRYTRLSRSEDQSFYEYLDQSYQNFLVGLRPANLISSFVNDISYNKAGLAPLSVVLDVKKESSGILESAFGWLRPEIFSSVPSFLRNHLVGWSGHSAEEIVSRLLGVGVKGWSSAGVSSELSQGWIVDLLDTPMLNAAANGGLIGIVSAATITAVLIAIAWTCVIAIQRRFKYVWVISCTYIAAIAFSGSWLGGLIVATKVGSLYVFLCILLEALSLLACQRSRWLLKRLNK